MRSLFVAAVAAALLAACTPPATKAPEPAPTPEVIAATPIIADAWAGTTPNGATVAAGYMSITNPGAIEDKLVSAASPRAARVEIHEMKMEGTTMSMAPVTGGVVVAPGASVALAPGGFHLMFMDVTGPFVAGETVPVTLTFEKAGAVEVALGVRDRTAEPGAKGAH